MNVENTIRQVLLLWPSISPNRFSVLEHLFITIGNGYEWQDGELVELGDQRGFKNRVPTVEEAIISSIEDTFLSDLTFDFVHLHMTHKKFKSSQAGYMEAMRFKIECVKEEINLILRTEERMHDMSIPVFEKYPKYMEHYNNLEMPYPIMTIYQYSELCNLPFNIKPDWLKAARELYEFLVAHPENYEEGHDLDFIEWLPKVRTRLEILESGRQNMSPAKWLYRLEAEDPKNGLWYNSSNEYVWGCRDCAGEAKNLPMGPDERYHIDGRNWFSSCSRKEDLLHWYSKEDAKWLLEHGFVFTRYLALDYHEFGLETVFLKETAVEREVIDFMNLFEENIYENNMESEKAEGS